MTYTIDWRPIRSAADLPKDGQYVLTSWQDHCVGENWCEEGKWALGDGTPIIAWAPLPAPYDSDEAEPVDMRAVSNVQTGCMSACEGFEELEERIEQQDQELAAIRAAVLALAGELDGQAIVGMGIKDVVKRLRGIAG